MFSITNGPNQPAQETAPPFFDEVKASKSNFSTDGEQAPQEYNKDALFYFENIVFKVSHCFHTLGACKTRHLSFTLG